MLSAEQHAAFHDSGLMRLGDALAPGIAGALRERVWEFLERELAIRRDAPATWKSVPPSTVRPLHDQGAFDAMASERVRAALDCLLGKDAWQEPKRWGQLLMHFPQRGPWTLPSKVWHLDYTAPGWRRGLPGAQVFLFLDEVAPGGGGTLAIAGSQRLVQRIQQASPIASGRSAQIRHQLRSEVGWLKDLWSERKGEDRVRRFMDAPATVDGIALQVVEMCGTPGEMIVMHPWVLHAPAPNCGSRARMMLTERLYARDPGAPQPSSA